MPPSQASLGAGLGGRGCREVPATVASKAGLWFPAGRQDLGVRPRLGVRVTEAVPEPGRLLPALLLRGRGCSLDCVCLKRGHNNK